MLADRDASGTCRKVGWLGKEGPSPDNGPMNEETAGKGFQFPGVFEITAMGPVAAGLEVVIPRELALPRV